VFNNTNAFGSEAYYVEQDLSSACQLDDAVELFDLKKIPEISCGIYSQLFGQNKAFSLRVYIDNTDYINIQKREGVTLDKLYEEFTGSASAHNRQINGKGYSIGQKKRFFRTIFVYLILFFHDLILTVS